MPIAPNNIAPHTYVAGEDEGRLRAAAQHLGLQDGQGRAPKTSWTSLLLHDNTLTAARMHSVGTVARDERVDEFGTLHLMSVRRRDRGAAATTLAAPSVPPKISSYDKLTDLFAKPSLPEEQEEEEEIMVALKMGDEDQVVPPKKTLDDYDDDDLIVEDMVEGGSLVSAMFGIVKGTVGPAILYLPRGFYVSGYAVAVPCMIFATGMFIFSAYRLLECWKLESDKNHQVETRLKEVQALLGGSPKQQQHLGGGVTNHSDSLALLLQKSPNHNHRRKTQNNNHNSRSQYGATQVQQIITDHGYVSKLLTYPELAKRALGPWSVLVEVGIALFQFGVCLTYLIFVPDNLHACAKALGLEVSKPVLLWMMIGVEIPLSWIRDIRRLTTTNVIASLLILLGLGSVLWMAVLEGTHVTYNADTQENELLLTQNLRSLKPVTENWFLFVGTSFFMMEGSITLLVPLQEAVYRPEDRARFPDINRTVTSWIVVFYICFSVVACAAFGSHMQTALTASLTGKLATFVQVAYSIAVMLTFPLQAFPAMEVAIRMMHKVTGSTSSRDRTIDDKEHDWERNRFATIIVIVLGVIAVYSVNYLGNVVSILGSLFGIPLALVFPPLMHNALIKDSSVVTRSTNYLVVLVGFFAMAAASFNTIVQWDAGAEG